MKNEQDYIKDISEIRGMMERSSKFLSLAGWAGIAAGIYALVGAAVVHWIYGFGISGPVLQDSGEAFREFLPVLSTGLSVLLLAVGTAVILSKRKADKKKQRIWNATSRKLLTTMAVPLVTGGVFILILLSQGLTGLIAPASLLFYGLALYFAGAYTYQEIRTLGVIQIVLGLLAAYFVGYGILFWAVGFGVFHIVYGLLMHLKYDK